MGSDLAFKGLGERASMFRYSTLPVLLSRKCSVYFAVRPEALHTVHVYLRPESVSGAGFRRGCFDLGGVSDDKKKMSKVSFIHQLMHQ